MMYPAIHSGPWGNLFFVPMIDPVVPLGTKLSGDAVVAVVNLDVLKPVGREMLGQPVRVLDDVVFRYIRKIAGPTAPHRRRPVENGDVKRGVTWNSQNLGVVVGNQPDDGWSREGHRKRKMLPAHGPLRKTGLG